MGSSNEEWTFIPNRGMGGTTIYLVENIVLPIISLKI
jgi:hypothetical protein